MFMRKIIFTLIILQLISQSLFSQNNIPYGDNKAVGKFYNIRGFKMYCEVYGNGKPLLMIHGNGGSMECFKNQLSYFATHFKVILADSRAQASATWRAS